VWQPSGAGQHQRHASGLSFVRHKLSQLVEAPTVVAIALRLADPGALANARQILQGNPLLRSLCRLNKLFADAVVNRSHVALFSAREPSQQPFGFFRAFALERAPDFRVVRTEAVDFRSFVGFGTGIHRDTPSAEIDTQRAGWCGGRRSGAFELDM